MLKIPVLAPNPSSLPLSVRARVSFRSEHGSSTSVKTKGGWLAGTDRGEWGGEIVFYDWLERGHQLVGENTQDLFEIPGGALAICGLAHLQMNDGMAYRITRDAAGKWNVEPWRVLPGAPRLARALPGGGWLVVCYYGIVSISPAGEMKDLPWADVFHQPVSAAERPGESIHNGETGGMLRQLTKLSATAIALGWTAYVLARRRSRNRRGDVVSPRRLPI